MTSGKRPATGVVCALLIGAVMSVPVRAADPPPVVTIADRVATASFDLGSAAGMQDWTIAGTDHLSQQWYWIAVDGGPATSIDQLGLFGFLTADTNLDGVDDQLSFRYDNNITQVDATLTLRGSGSGLPTSTLSQLVKIENVSNDPLDISFFQYADLDLGGTADDAMVVVNLPDSITQTDFGPAVMETSVGPNPSHYAASLTGAPLGLPALLGAGDMLSDIAGPSGPGDLAWAFEWDFTLQPGEVFNISEDNFIVPEPATGLLAAIGAAVLIRRKRQ